MLLPESGCACIPSFRPVALRVYLVQVLFLAFFGPDTDTGRGVALMTFLKCSPNDTDSKYIWVQGYNYLGSSVF